MVGSEWSGFVFSDQESQGPCGFWPWDLFRLCCSVSTFSWDTAPLVPETSVNLQSVHTLFDFTKLSFNGLFPTWGCGPALVSITMETRAALAGVGARRVGAQGVTVTTIQPTIVHVWAATKTQRWRQGRGLQTIVRRVWQTHLDTTGRRPRSPGDTSRRTTKLRCSCTELGQKHRSRDFLSDNDPPDDSPLQDQTENICCSLLLLLLLYKTTSAVTERISDCIKTIKHKKKMNCGGCAPPSSDSWASQMFSHESQLRNKTSIVYVSWRL